MLSIKFNMLSSWANFISTGVALQHAGCMPAGPVYGAWTEPSGAAYGTFTEVASPAYGAWTEPPITPYSTGC